MMEAYFFLEFLRLANDSQYGLPVRARFPEVGRVKNVQKGKLMTAYEIIAKKRDGKDLSKVEIQFFIQEYLNGNIKDYQMSVLLMAIYFNGMNNEEISALTGAYIQSGKVIDLVDIPGIKVDKHSTGGVGDKVSIVLAPLAASLGVPVPMISGRGLGHTGGTLDKLESIPGFKVFGTLESFKKQLQEVGVAMLGQTNSIVPADKRIYALRDVTATVESIPLITASIMSKKIAEGIDGLVLDVKYGNGAFMSEVSRAEELAANLIRVGSAFGKKVVASLTSMEQPLGFKIGNWLEIEECLDCFHGNGPDDLKEIILSLTAEMLVLGEKANDIGEARKMCEQALVDGSAYRKFLEMVEYQGGDMAAVESPQKYPVAKYRHQLKALQSGYVTAFNTKQIGMAGVQLGAGRLRAEDPVDPQAGIVLFKKVGDEVQAGEALLEARTNADTVWNEVEKKLQNAITIGDKPSVIPELILKRLANE